MHARPLGGPVGLYLAWMPTRPLRPVGSIIMGLPKAGVRAPAAPAESTPRSIPAT